MFRSSYLLALVLSVALAQEVSFVRRSFGYDKFKHVSVGGAGVWAVLSDNTVWRREVTLNSQDELDTTWVPVQGLNMTQIDVGAHTVWGIDASGNAFIRTNITNENPNGEAWRAVPSNTSFTFSHVTVSSNGHVWATDTSRKLYRRKGASNANPDGSEWDYITTSLQQVSAGLSGVWGIYNSALYYLQGSYGDGEGTTLTYVGTSFKYVSSGEEYIVVVDTNNVISIRVGSSAEYPTGMTWKGVGNNLNMVENFEEQLWGVSSQGVLWNAEYQTQWCRC